MAHGKSQKPPRRRSVTHLATLAMCHVPCVIFLPPAASAQPRIIDIGLIPGANFAHGFGLSADGASAAGSSGSALFTRAFHWSSSGGMQALEPLPGGIDSYAYAISADGTVVVGGSAISSTATRAARWTGSGGGGATQNLGILPGGNDSTALAANADGETIVGWSDSSVGHRAFRWTSFTGMTDLGVFPGGTASIAQAISADGQTIAGSGDTPAGQRAFRWTAELGFQDLGTLPGHDYSGAHAISADGAAIAGESGVSFTFPPPPELPLRAFRWTPSSMQDLGLLPGGTRAQARAISGDGRAVAGIADTNSSAQHAFLWTDALGIVDLNTYLPTIGINLDTWTLTDAHALNHDGSAILGHGFHAGVYGTWIALLETCYPNCDNSTTAPILNVDDFTCFINEFAQAQSLPHEQQLTAYANCDNSTIAPALNVDDFTCFINAFAAGCP